VLTQHTQQVPEMRGRADLQVIPQPRSTDDHIVIHTLCMKGVRISVAGVHQGQASCIAMATGSPVMCCRENLHSRLGDARMQCGYSAGLFRSVIALKVHCSAQPYWRCKLQCLSRQGFVHKKEQVRDSEAAHLSSFSWERSCALSSSCASSRLLWQHTLAYRSTSVF
jgi:hypothetical protein